MKMKKGDAGIVVLVIALFLVVIAMSVFVLYNRINENQNIADTENSAAANGSNNNSQNQNTTVLDEHKGIELNNSEKARINEELLNKFHKLFISITGLNLDGVKLEDLTYNVNLLDDEKNQYKIVWNSLISDDTFRQYLTIDKEQSGVSTIEFKHVQEAYKKYLNKSVSEKTLLEVDEYADSHVTNGVYYAAVTTGGFGDMNYCIKANKLELNEKTGIYTLTTDIVLDKEFNIRESEVTNWDNSLNKASLLIQYKITNNSKTLISLVLKKKDTSASVAKAYKLGDSITLKDGSKWVVLKDSLSSQDYVTILSTDVDFVNYLQGSEWDAVYEQFLEFKQYKNSALDKFMQSQSSIIPATLKEVDGYQIRLITLDELFVLDNNFKYNEETDSYKYIGSSTPNYPKGITTMTPIKRAGYGKIWAYYTAVQTVCYDQQKDCKEEHYISTYKSGLGGFYPVVNVYKNSI